MVLLLKRKKKDGVGSVALVKQFKLLGHLSNLCPQSLHPTGFSEVQKDQVLERTAVLAQWPGPLLVHRGVMRR